MMQSTLHVGIIMDGNGRWATTRGRPRAAGHREGARAVRRIVQAAPRIGVGTLTLYAFSADNWKRPKAEVDALMALFVRYLRGETATFVENGIRLSVIGRRDRLAASVLRAIETAENATAAGTALDLRIAIDYSARDAITEAAARAAKAAADGRQTITGRASFVRFLGEAIHDRGSAPDVDLLIRTGGEQRLSDFLLWECAYAELVFSGKMWPEWTPEDFAAAVHWYRGRERRFGGLPAAV